MGAEGRGDVPSKIGEDGDLRLGRCREGGHSALSAKDGSGNGGGREDEEGGDELREEHRGSEEEWGEAVKRKRATTVG